MNQSITSATILEEIVINMLITKGKVFYANLLTQMSARQVAMPKTTLGAGVTINRGLPLLVYDPEIWKEHKLTKDDLTWILEHELMHLLLSHMARRFNKHPMMWNYATDMAINCKLESTKMPVLLPDAQPFNFPNDLSAEEYYEMLYKKFPPQGDGQGDGGEGGTCPDCGGYRGDKPEDGEGNQEGEEGKDGQGKSKSQKPCTCPKKKDGITSDGKGNIEVTKNGVTKKFKLSQHSKEIEKTMEELGDLADAAIHEAVSKAYDAVKDKGDIPGGLQEVIEGVLAPPKISWRNQLRHLIGKSVRAGKKSSWKYENKRCNGDVKGYARKRGLFICVMIDTSGSVSDKELSAFITEIRGIQKSYTGTKVYLIQCDAKVNDARYMKQWGQNTFEIKGRGGTSFKPPFIHLKENHINPDAIVYLTDMEGDFPERRPLCPTIWVSTIAQHDTAPFGSVVILDVNED